MKRKFIHVKVRVSGLFNNLKTLKMDPPYQKQAEVYFFLRLKNRPSQFVN